VKFLFVGDIVGRPGRICLGAYLSDCRKKNISYDFIIANVENAAGGFGLTKEISQKISSYGVDVQTSGNHIWDRKEIHSYFEAEPRLLRPANYPVGAPGLGYNLYASKNGETVAVINLQGRIFMPNIDCPFRTADRIIGEIAEQAKLIFVDFHAEATSEKQALGRYLDGRISGLFGTHTHVQTADECILAGGTAYITDAGMTGPYASVIGVETKDALYRIITGLPNRFNIAERDIRMAAIVVDADPATGKASSIERIMYNLSPQDEASENPERRF
jgi:2',3'-cyclic-nucleotide 2'-phosphodiesterase